MRSIIKKQGALYVLSAVMLTVALLACQEDAEFARWIQKVDLLRQEVEKQVDVIPYQTVQQEAFREYFIELENTSLKLKQDNNFAVAVSNAVAKSDLEQVCAKIFLLKPRWDHMMKNCTKNGFFLCSEEVRFYPDMVRSFRESLLSEQQKRFDDTASCTQAM